MDEMILFTACLCSFATEQSAAGFFYAFSEAHFAFVFHTEKWILIILAILNISLSFVLHNVPFIFIIFVSILLYHIFYRFYFSSPISKTEKSIKEEFIKDFLITKREREVILALLDGKSNKELAETLVGWLDFRRI